MIDSFSCWLGVCVGYKEVLFERTVTRRHANLAIIIE